jgi:hypothetical protein
LSDFDIARQEEKLVVNTNIHTYILTNFFDKMCFGLTFDIARQEEKLVVNTKIHTYRLINFFDKLCFGLI